jgi:hypothetical protein
VSQLKIGCDDHSQRLVVGDGGGRETEGFHVEASRRKASAKASPNPIGIFDIAPERESLMRVNNKVTQSLRGSKRLPLKILFRRVFMVTCLA